MARKWLNLFAGAALSFAVAGNTLADEGKITVFAAASLTNAMQDIATQYKKEKGVDVVSSFASSSTLARQIEVFNYFSESYFGCNLFLCSAFTTYACP